MSTMKYFLIASLVIMTSCQQPAEESSTAAKKYLFVSSGLCYSGVGVTTFSATTASNLIYKVDTDTGQREDIIADFFASPASAGDSPISIIDWSSENLLVMIRNGTGGRLETLPKKGGTRNSFGTTPAIGSILTTAPQNMAKTSDGGVLLIRTGYMEKINASGIRQNTPFVSNNLGATCGTANTLYTNIAITGTGRIITANAAASPNNRVISVPASGATGSCSAGLAAPATTTYATAFAFDAANGKLLVAYSGNSSTTANINSIHAYDFDEATGAITNDQTIYDASLYPTTYGFLLFGISAMTLDPETNTLYVATAISNATTVLNYAIEKLKYDATKIGSSNTEVLTKSGTLPFYNYGVDTKCISALVVASDSPATTP